ncbi:molybdopterin-dependent oxidoreductase [Anaerolinea thermolimosa]|uniref:molybdopterin-dependent oxidoreductase n=1 Tax=Anaerolinea thermolimosa TaxID=229919 RepID=UPI0007808FB1|nr:molybdopterin cofactor-binding domain-containing protein [Anaerolinea thermolimosa]
MNFNGQWIDINVNGIDYHLPEIPGEMLSDLLRYRLGLTGTKIGCNEAECGACTVLLNGKAILSCSFPAKRAHGCEIITIEGLASPGEKPDERILHPLQQAFVLYGAVQCGFCIPGQIMAAYGLLVNNNHPTAEDIRYALKDNLCRCGGYTAIIRAILAAAKAIRTGKPVEPPEVPEAVKAHEVVGRIHIRPDGIQKVTGTARYADDLTFDGMLHARVKRAMIPSGIVMDINLSKAEKIPGVVAILTAEDLPGEKNHGLVIQDWPILVGVGERVRTAGDAVAIIAAETREIATRAMNEIEVSYHVLPVVSDPVQARAEDAPRVHEKGNLLKHIKVRKGDINEGFLKADIILEDTFYTPMYEHAFIEPECSVAKPLPDGRMEIYVGSQIPYSDRSQVARALGVPDEQVRVIGMTIGGGFGGKEDIAGQIHAALLAQRTRRPVKLLFDRHESMLVHPKRHATQIKVKVGVRRDGTLMAMQTELYGDTGAYASLGEKVMTRATTHSSGPYEVPSVRADCYAMYTNNPPAGAFRGFGVLQSAFAVESMMDRLAEALGMDPVELRRKNALRVGSVTSTGQVLKDSAGLQECIDKVEAEMRRIGGSDPFSPKMVDGAPHLVRSWGFATAYKNTGLGGGAPDKAGAQVELYPDGTFEVRTASAELGQGLPAVLQMIASQELMQSPQRVRVLLSDTDLTPDGGPTTASRQTYVTGNAVRYAAHALGELIIGFLSEHYDISPERIRFEEGLAVVGDERVTLEKIADLMIREGRSPVTTYTYYAPETRPLGEDGDMHFAYSFAAQAVEVEVNRLTGEVRVIRVITANDVGFAVNPLGLQGQIEGGVMMGIGHALTEAFWVEEGKVVTDRFSKYRIPSIIHTPEIHSFVVEHPTSEGPYGAKGVGEIVIIPTVPAITNAIYHAVGVRVNRLPVDQEWILHEIKKSGVVPDKTIFL